MPKSRKPSTQTAGGVATCSSSSERCCCHPRRFDRTRKAQSGTVSEGLQLSRLSEYIAESRRVNVILFVRDPHANRVLRLLGRQFPPEPRSRRSGTPERCPAATL